ncbi:chorismate mutase [Croceicoccus sediminis]|uniref:chorismate mutase n=1 Tax=Croceicoccus sediminis TaxID=2571150 RepID=UPI001184485F|nr:chorismate mutase [Croceicoccus sediminis]
MNTPFKSPENCETMAEVRVGVDATDRALIDLLATRFGFMRAAARIKAERSEVRDEDRKAAVIRAAMNEALEKGVPVGLIAKIWEELVETSIAYEMEEWDRIRS